MKEERIGDCRLLIGDVMDVLPMLPAGSVQCVVTSPPYFGLRDYGVAPTDWPEIAFSPMPGLPEITVPAMASCLGLELDPLAFVAHLVAVFREVRRVLADDGVCFVNLGDSYAGTGKSGGGAQGKRWENCGADTIGPRGGKWQPPPTGLKPKDLMGIPWRFAFAAQADGWFLRQDVIWHKCLSGGATVYAKTAKGEMPMTVKDLVRLDPATVKLWDGDKWNQCLEWHEVGGDPDRKIKSLRARRAKYLGQAAAIEGDIEIEIRSGERIGCTREHRWPTTRGLIDAADLRPGDVLQWCQLPEPTKIRRPAALDDEMVGWFVGLYIAEGSRHDGTIHIASHKRETDRFDRLRALADAFDGYFFLYDGEGNGAIAVLNGPIINALIDAYVSGRTAADKHLSPRCWKRSNTFLRAVLDGYLSGDGHNRDGRWVLGFCKNDALATDLRVLCARIRASLRLRRCEHQMDGRTFPGWRGSLYFDSSKRRRPDTEIVAIRQSRARKFYDIVLETDPHLFALGSGVLTHNSNPMPESVRDRCTKAHEYLFLMTKSERYYWDAKAIAEAFCTDPRERYEERARIIGRGTQGAANARGNDRDKSGWFPPPSSGTRNRRSVWTIATQPYSGAHYATFPEALVEPCIKAASRFGDVVIDPFGGSGTTASVAAYLGRKSILVDVNPSSEAFVRERMASRETPLMDDLAPATRHMQDALL